MLFNKLSTLISSMQNSNLLSICVRSSGVVEGGAAPLVKLIDIGSWTHQSKQALVVAVCSCVVQRCPKKKKKKRDGLLKSHNQKYHRVKSIMNGSVNVNSPSKAVLPVEICPGVEEKIQTLKVPVVENTF